MLDTKGEAPVGKLLPATSLGPDIGGWGKSGGRRTIGRRIKTDPDFPQVYRISGRLFVRESDWEDYKKLLLRRGAEATPLVSRLNRGRPRKSDSWPDASS